MDEIKILKGPDRIRKRPAVIFGADDIDGVIKELSIILSIFSSEAVNNPKKLTVTIYPDSSIGILSEDRGLIINEEELNGKPTWWYDFCEPSVQSRGADDSFIYNDINKNKGLFGDTEINDNDGFCEYGFFDLCCIQLASEFMDVEVIRNGRKKVLHFYKGRFISDESEEASDSSSYTYIRFRPDTEVFSDIRIPYNTVVQMLRDLAVTIKGLSCLVEDQRSGASDTFLFNDGITDLVKTAIGKAENHTAVYTKEITGTGKERYNRREYTARVRVAVAFAESISEAVAFHNSHTLPNGGKHLQEVKAKLLKYIDYVFSDSADRKTLCQENIEKHLVIYLDSVCPSTATRWSDVHHTAIENIMIRDIASDTIDEDFRYFLKQNKNEICRILSISK